MRLEEFLLGEISSEADLMAPDREERGQERLRKGCEGTERGIKGTEGWLGSDPGSGAC